MVSRIGRVEQAVPPRGEADPGTHLILPWEGLAVAFLDFDPGDVAALANLADVGEGSQAVQQFAQERDSSFQGFQGAFLSENVQTREGRDAAEGFRSSCGRRRRFSAHGPGRGRR